VQEGSKRQRYKQHAENAYSYCKNMVVLAFSFFWRWTSKTWGWLVSGWEPERLTALSTFAIFLATAAVVGVGWAQWEALKRTDETTRESFTAVQRAFVFGKELLVKYDTEVMSYWRFAILVTNSGNTPTKGMEYVTISDRATPLDPEEAFVTTPKYVYGVPPSLIQRRSGDLLGPHDEFVLIGSETGVPAGSIAKMAEARENYYVRGVIHYRDVFKETVEHITKFCFAAIPYKSGQETKVSVQRCLYWNCADDDCKDDRERYDHDLSVLNPNLNRPQQQGSGARP
jgi:hypothetical protein